MPAGAPVRVIHTGPASSAPGHGYEGMTPYYEADIRPGESLVMPGFTISIEAARDRQHPAADRLPAAAQPVVTVTPADGDSQHVSVNDEDLFPRHRHDQHQQQQQPMSEHHPLAGMMRGRPPVGGDIGQYRVTDEQMDRSYYHEDVTARQHPRPPQHAPETRWQRGEMAEDARSGLDAAGPGRQASFTETHPAIDNVQVSSSSCSMTTFCYQPIYSGPGATIDPVCVCPCDRTTTFNAVTLTCIFRMLVHFLLTITRSHSTFRVRGEVMAINARYKVTIQSESPEGSTKRAHKSECLVVELNDCNYLQYRLVYTVSNEPT